MLDFMSTKTKPKQCETTVRIGEQYIEDVTYFKYLGAKVTKFGNTEAEIKTRINTARGALAALKNTWKTKIINKKTKIRIFKSSVPIPRVAMRWTQPEIEGGDYQKRRGEGPWSES